MSLLPVMGVGCGNECGGEVIDDAQSALTVWEEPLPEALSYPMIGSPKGPWEEGLTEAQMTSIGHSCSYLQQGSTCGNGICEAGEGTDPSTCWEDCVKQPWCNGMSCAMAGVPDKYLDKVVLYGVSTGRYWSTDASTNEPSFLLTDSGYPAASGGTAVSGYGSQLLIVRKLNQPRNGTPYCVEKRFRGKDLDAGPLSWTHNAEPTHDGHFLVTDTNGSTIYKLNGATFAPMWKLDGLSFDSSAANGACAAGPGGAASCCNASGCDQAFTVAPPLAPSGGISYENMIREVDDGGVYRYVISNRDWHTIVMVDAQNTTGSPPVVKSGTNHGKVSWAFGLYGAPAITSNDLCQVSLPHGVKFFPDTDMLYEADLAIGRVIGIPYNHQCYQAGSPSASLIDGTAPQARAVERASNGGILYTQNPSNNSPLTRQYPVEGAWTLRSNMTFHGGLEGSFAFDLQKLSVGGTSYYEYTGPTCQSSTLGANNLAREGVMTLWPTTTNGASSTPFFMYPAASEFANMGLVCDGT